jgi:undecaprenyl-diphosphatase
MKQRSPVAAHLERGTIALRPRRGIFHDIHSPGWFAKYPLLGLSMFLFGGAVFGLVVHHFLTGGPLLAWDAPLAERMHARALASPEWLMTFMIVGYFVGDQIVAVIGLVFAFYFVRKRRWRELTMVIFGFGVSALMFLWLAHTFDRPRPDFEPELWKGANIWGWEGGEGLPGFPSGHAIAVISSYGLLTYFFLPKIRSWRRRALVIGGVLLVAVYVNYSRLFLCDHFLSDMIAGTAFGIAWLGLAQTSVELLFRKRQ